MVVRRLPAPALRRAITAYYGFRSDEPPTRRHEGPGADVVLILSFDHGWRIDGEPRVSFVGGLRLDQVVTESDGGMHGLQVSLAPWAAHMLLGVPQSELAGTSVPLAALDRERGRRRKAASRPDAGVVYAWDRLRATHGTVRVGSLAAELDWSRK